MTRHADGERPPGNVVTVERRYPRVLWTDEAGAHDRLLERRTVVGASAVADIVIADPAISRVHAELVPRSDGLWVRDLDSRNGTFVNGAAVAEVCLSTSGDLKLGRTTLRVDFEGGVVGTVELWNGERLERMVGRSAAMRELFASVHRVAASDASVLVTGETGTGKELVAQSLHDLSPRREAPFVVVDCAALPENLIEAELFGHAKGSFTGAVEARAGAIESADGGTIFLDEIGELPLSMQPKLLRVLEQRHVRRIGETHYRPIDVRFVFATHRDLLALVGKKEFREDLYFRLCVIPVQVPPLRDRREDIELLVQNFGYGARFSPELIRELEQMPWRGNVRELRNFLERAAALGPGAVPRPAGSAARRALPSLGSRGAPGEVTRAVDDLDDGDVVDVGDAAAPVVGDELAKIPLEGDFKVFRERWVELGEKAYLRRVLEKHGGNVALVAKEACVAKTYVYRLMRKYEL